MKSCVSEIHACNFFFVCSNPGGVRSPGDDQAKRPRDVGLGGLDLSFRREGEEDEARSEGELVGSGKEEDVERRTEEEEGVRRVGGEEEGRETESDDGTPRPNGGRNQRKFKIKMSKNLESLSLNCSGRNRRKPLAPQWVNPADWTADRAEDLANKVS